MLKRNGNDATYMTQYMVQKIYIGFHGYREKDIKMGRNYRDEIHIHTPFSLKANASGVTMEKFCLHNLSARRMFTYTEYYNNTEYYWRERGTKHQAIATRCINIIKKLWMILIFILYLYMFEFFSLGKILYKLSHVKYILIF